MTNLKTLKMELTFCGKKKEISGQSSCTTVNKCYRKGYPIFSYIVVENLEVYQWDKNSTKKELERI